MVSMTAGFVQTFTKDCQTVGLGSTACSSYPNYATNYFNTSTAYAIEAVNLTADGYVLESVALKQSVCLGYTNTSKFCSIENEVFIATDVLKSNDWNFGSPAYAGIIGLAPSSAVWNFVDVNNTGMFTYQTQFTNNNNWTFAEPHYTVRSANNTITL